MTCNGFMDLHDEDPEDLDSGEAFVTKEEFLNALDEISTQEYVLKLHLEELQRKVQETPEQLTCESSPESAKKTCTVHHALGLSPTYMINFSKGHDSSKPTTLCIYVRRPGTKKTLQYEGEIIGFPEHLDPGTSALISGSKKRNGKIIFRLVGYIEDKTEEILSDILDIVQAQQKKISELEGKIDELSDMYASGR